MGEAGRVPAISLRVSGKCSRMKKSRKNMGFMLCAVRRRSHATTLPQLLVFRLKTSVWTLGEGSVAIGASNSVWFRVVAVRRRARES